MFYFSVYLAAVCCIVGIECSSKVKLREVTALTLHKGEYTVGRRSAPILQLQCVRGTACQDSQPSTVQCYNRGFDGVDVQWECQAELRKDYVFGKMEVSCEGYDHPEDPYVLKGSCGLKYELNYASGSASKKQPSEKEDSSNHGWMFWVLLVGVVGLFVFALVPSSASRAPNSGERFTGGGWDGGPPSPPGSGGPRAPPPPGFKTPQSDAPPPYEEACGRSTPGQGSANEGPGFWSGMGLGGIGGYLLARMNSDNYGNVRHRGPGQFGLNTGFFDGPSTSGFRRSPSPESRTASGFGGTTRR